MGAMNFRQLQVFQAVARNKSFTGAAKELFLTQPAVSIQIQQLEEAYQTKLFDRLGKRVSLTEAGKILFDYASTILDMSRQAESALQDLQELKTGSLSIGAGRTLGAYYVPEIINRFSKKYPYITVRMRLDNSFQVIENVLALKDELGFVARLHQQDRLTVLPFFRENLVLIMSGKHPLAGEENLSIHDIQDERFILREQGSGTRRVVEETLQRFQVPVRVVMELGSNEAIKSAVEGGVGMAIIASRAVLKEVKAKALVARSFTDTEMPRELYMVYHKDKYLSAPIREFIEQAKMAFR